MMPSAGASRTPPSSTARSTPRCPGSHGCGGGSNAPTTWASATGHAIEALQPLTSATAADATVALRRGIATTMHRQSASPPPMQAMAAPRRICSRRRCSRYRLRRSRFAYPSSIIPPFRPSPPITSVAATPGSSPAVPGNVVERRQVIHRNTAPRPVATRRSCTRVIYGYSYLLVRGSSPGAEHSCVAQLAEHPTVNRTVAGSSPAAGATTEKPLDSRGFSHIAATACDRDASSITHAR